MAAERQHGDGRDDCGRDAGAYALGALEAEEVARFRTHLETCAVCRDEVQTLREVAERLPMAVPQLAVRRSLRRRVMRGLRERGLHAEGGRAVPRRGRSRRGRVLPAAPLTGRLASSGSAAALVIVALIAGGATYAGVKLSEGKSGRHERVVRARVEGSPGRAVVRLRAGRAELIVDGMPAPPAGKVYEVWLARAGAPPAATSALFDVTTDGSAVVDVPGDLRGVSEVLVTPEPRGGSAVPTHAPAIIARLA
jgi:anti-sigma-K factor RskA